MYNQLSSLRTEQQVELLTKQLIQIESYNGTAGEVNKANYLFEIISSFPYFQTHPNHVWKQELDGDKRFNVWAYLQGNTDKKETVIYHAHVDTVGIEDYGKLKDIAHNPDKLAEFFQGYEGDEETREDAQSGEWMFGRGSLDMQSGISIHLVNLLYYMNNREKLDGNILVLFNVDEENQHIGIRGALDELVRLQQERGLSYVAAINNDFISPLYNGDKAKYVYCGGAGKLLPCFSILGREAHVGESLLGIDPTLIASEINRNINQNFSLAEKLDNELVLPPSCLFMKENKQSYNVQTPLSTRMYFNYFIYKKTPSEVLVVLKKIAEAACAKIESELAENYLAFRKANQLPERSVNWKTDVITLQEYMDYLKKSGEEPEKLLESLLVSLPEDLDDRLKAFALVESLQQLDPEKKPRVILFFATPFLPSNTLQEDEKSVSLKEALKEVLHESEEEYKEEFPLRGYFPYLCDGSFLAFNGDQAEIETVKANFPGMHTLFPIDLEKMSNLNIPALNIGVYGKGGHKWTERVYKPYTFQTLPLLIRKVTERLLSL
ncbi:M20/M25/M40 family metallo-hydrolase [Niallia alba]|uniref:M20/M25/M40 family metallo-hydrolase n=1 Tax=Niallia alba TaxID=2729105 RepID=A0A7Y0PMN1_9BACI|nr:M20/M25/M40 family metallo-hydrolase [Niallia alba]MED3794590.1 M20/M25/M40 family metallo-hydrolase [Niallia alba]NMO76609.1 M20/M25/M40 family metallo-hydrolase [Niallia alba]